MRTVAVLFARKDSIYKTLDGVDVYDIDRDARTFTGGMPIVAHPPCRAWGELRHMAKPRPDEKDLAVWSIEQIRKHGGVLEHPHKSQLWQFMELPRRDRRDEYGGFSVSVDQSWWGHRARKKTLLYICGIAPYYMPPLPITFNRIDFTVSCSGRRKDGTRTERRGREIPKSEREKTPIAFAEWLVEVARGCRS